MWIEVPLPNHTPLPTLPDLTVGAGVSNLAEVGAGVSNLAEVGAGVSSIHIVECESHAATAQLSPDIN